MNENMQIRPNPLNHAMLMGLEMGVWFALTFILDAQGMGVLASFVTFYVIYGVYRAAQHYKETEWGGQITYFAAYSYILWLYVCSSLVASVIRFAYLQWLNPEFLPKLYDSSMLMMEELKKEGLKMSMDEVSSVLQAILTPIRFTMYYIMIDLFKGTFWGLILALIVKRRKARFIYPFGGKRGRGGNDDDRNDLEKK